MSGTKWGNPDIVDDYIDANRLTRRERKEMDLIKLSELPDLSAYEPDSVDLVADYWTPEEANEQRRMFFFRCEVRSAPDYNDESKNIQLPCAVFVEPTADGPRTVVNGSKRLVAAVESLPEGTPVQITYLGREKNKTNSHQSDRWAIVTLAEGGAA